MAPSLVPAVQPPPWKYITTGLGPFNPRGTYTDQRFLGWYSPVNESCTVGFALLRRALATRRDLVGNFALEDHERVIVAWPEACAVRGKVETRSQSLIGMPATTEVANAEPASGAILILEVDRLIRSIPKVTSEPNVALALPNRDLEAEQGLPHSPGQEPARRPSDQHALLDSRRHDGTPLGPRGVCDGMNVKVAPDHSARREAMWASRESRHAGGSEMGGLIVPKTWNFASS